jgi:uncharacterized protein YkwD
VELILSRRLFKSLRLMVGSALLIGAGCQGQNTLPLGPSSLTPGPKDVTSRTTQFDPCTNPPDQHESVRDMLEAVNAERARHGISPLRTDATLTQIAEFYACRLVEGGFFAHDDPYDGSTVDSRAADFGYPFIKIGENLAAGQASARESLADWLKSPSHRANLLDPAFTQIGIAVKAGGELGPYWVQEFGRPLVEGVPAGTTSVKAASQPVADKSDAAAASSK